MLAADEKPVEILNELILINNDRIEGYNYASKETDIEILKVLFSRLTETSLVCRKELVNEVYKLGGRPADGIHDSGEASKAWQDLKEALIYKDHLSLLKTCAKEEEIVIKTYENFINEKDENISTQQFRLFYKHQDMLHADREKVKNLLNVLLKAS
jgi:uncharacterized protein (TIGR02284 family)